MEHFYQKSALYKPLGITLTRRIFRIYLSLCTLSICAMEEANLCSYIANLRLQNKTLDEQLHDAIRRTNLDLCKQLIYQGASVKYPLLLTAATSSKNLPLISWLIEQYPQLLDAQFQDGFTPLHAAALNEQLELVDYFANRKPAWLLVAEQLNQRPLDIALFINNPEIIRCLLSHEISLPTKLNEQLPSCPIQGTKRTPDSSDILPSPKKLV